MPVSRFAVPEDPLRFAPLVAVMEHAGRAIEEVQSRRDPGVEVKGDGSPVTAADLASNDVLLAGLAEHDPDFPVLSEETHEKGDAPPQTAWVVDPLDGTKEFLKQNGEYVVNLGLMVDRRPILGLVHDPAGQETFLGGAGWGAWRWNNGDPQPLVAPRFEGTTLRIVGSRSHRGPLMDDMVKRLEADGIGVEEVPMGSARKLMLVAEGRADTYPRLGPTMWWDTLAPHAIVEGAGGRVLGPEGTPLQYEAPDLLNPYFLVLGGAGPRDDGIVGAFVEAAGRTD